MNQNFDVETSSFSCNSSNKGVMFRLAWHTAVPVSRKRVVVWRAVEQNLWLIFKTEISIYLSKVNFDDNRPFSYSRKEPGSSDIFIQFYTRSSIEWR